MNLSGIPTAVCPNCGSDQIWVVVKFDEEYNIGWWGLDEAKCYKCHTIMTVVCPADYEERFKL